MEDKAKRGRSPQFPFIALDKAVTRVTEFEAAYQQHTARVPNAVKIWGYAEKSSGGIQTIAALSGYGLIEDDGSLENRRLKLTPLALTILKDARAGARESALRKAALTPKVIAELWKAWGAKRPPDAECISHLHLDRNFTEEGAERFLAIYDTTIRYAKLVSGDIINTPDEITDAERGRDDEPIKPPPPPPAGKVRLMENERVVFSHELKQGQSFRIIVAGDVDSRLVDAIKAFADFQEKLLPKSGTTEPPKTE